jgi:hypothetical protein
MEAISKMMVIAGVAFIVSITSVFVMTIKDMEVWMISSMFLLSIISLAFLIIPIAPILLR